MVYYAAAALLASGLVASVSAGSIHAHHNNLHKKGIEYKAPAQANATCGCTTYTTTWYGEATLVPGTSTSSSSSSSSTPVTTSSVAPTTYAAPKPSTTSTSSSSWSSPAPVYSAPSKNAPPPKVSSSSAPSYSAPAPSYSAPASSSSAAPSYSSPASSSSAPAPSKSSSSSNGGCAEISPNGNKWAMTYTPYSSSGGCKSADDVSKDIAGIKSKGFTTVRLYATDCSGIENIGAACKEQGLNMILGVYIDSEGISKAREQVSTITTWGKTNGWGKVEMVVVGNEAVFNNYCTASELAEFIQEVKSSFKAAGYTGPCTTTEPLNIIQENADTICGACDVIGANIHPFFNTAIDASGAGDFVSSQLALVKSVCGGSKEAYNLETGWPSAGDANGAAVPGVSQQKTAVDGIIASAGSKSAIFSYENDSWKSPGNLGVEQYWGCADIFQDVLNVVNEAVSDVTGAVSNIL